MRQDYAICTIMALTNTHLSEEKESSLSLISLQIHFIIKMMWFKNSKMIWWKHHFSFYFISPVIRLWSYNDLIQCLSIVLGYISNGYILLTYYKVNSTE